MKPYMTVLMLVILSGSLWTSHSYAQTDSLHYNLISLQESVEIEVDNDVMYARVFSQHVDRRADQVAKLINTDMQWALQQIRKHKAIKAETLNYSTYPQYKDRKIKSWSGRQEMSLESSDFELLSRVIADLQARLQVNNIHFGVSAKKYKQTEDSLITDAVKAFNKKANIIAKAMSKPEFKVVNLNVNTNRHYAQPIQRRSKSFDLVAAESVAVPQPGLEAGSNTVRVNVSGQVQLR